MFSIKIEPGLKQKLPSITLGCIQAKVHVSPSPDVLSQFIHKNIEQIAVSLTAESIRQMDTVKATKDAYRSLGKDPNRYRPAAEALMRRIANGKGLYQISNVVDILNFISVKTGYSICGYDAHSISGEIVMGIGDTNEPYEGIGRGVLNIESLPVFRDDLGGFGTPTSDSVRTMITEKTNEILFIFIGLGDKNELEKALQETELLLKEYTNISHMEIYYQ